MNAYEQGFIDKCAAAGVDPARLTKAIGIMVERGRGMGLSGVDDKIDFNALRMLKELVDRMPLEAKPSIGPYMAAKSKLLSKAEGSLTKSAIDPMTAAQIMGAIGSGAGVGALTAAIPGAAWGIARGRGLMRLLAGNKRFLNKLQAGTGNIVDYEAVKSNRLLSAINMIRDAARGARWRNPVTGTPAASLADQARMAALGIEATGGAAAVPAGMALMKGLM